MDKKRLVFLVTVFLFLIFLLAFSIKEKDNINTVVNHNIEKTSNYSLIGTNDGLYFLDLNSKKKDLIFDKGIISILKTSYGFFVLTRYEGIFFSEDLKSFKQLNKGIYSHKIKIFNKEKNSFEPKEMIDYIKSIKHDPSNDSFLIANSSKNIYYSVDKGNNWTKVDISPAHSSSITDSAIFSIKDGQNIKTYIIYATSFKGIFLRAIGEKAWQGLTEGLYKYTGMIEDVFNVTAVNYNGGVKVLASNSFSPIVYELDFKTKKWVTVLKLKKDFGMIASLSYSDDKINFVSEDGIFEYIPSKTSLNKLEFKGLLDINKDETKPFSLLIINDDKVKYSFDNLWLLFGHNFDKNKEIAKDKKGLYLQYYIPNQKTRFDNILELMKDLNLNMIVIDMKDDFGILRFNPQDPVLKAMGQVNNPINLDDFIKKCKENKIYVVARIVVFKDKVLYHYNNYELAVKDRKGKPWRGIVSKKGVEDYNSEFWVDPYSHKVWDYNVRIAKELVSRGFDEIQFDYIRFPTDGINLGDATFSYYEKGMDKETALLSFLTYARDSIDAPISIDIYGANGWHRTGGRTGQEVEILKDFVDVICPMYYPSHFSQDFLNYAPYEDRTYRIYYFGSLRNFYIAQKSVVIRPYVQAFKLNVSYDRAYYGPSYIKNQVKGVVESINLGYTFWNPATNYVILRESFLIKNFAGDIVNGKTN